MAEKPRVVVVGAGLMGPGIAACATLAGHPATLIDLSEGIASQGVERANENITQLLVNGLVQPEQAEQARGLLEAGTDAGQYLGDAFLIVEAVSEDLNLKQRLFQELDALAPTDIIIASNTSGLRITDISRLTRHPGRTVTTHFWFPAHLVPLVEVVMGDSTKEATAIKVRDTLLTWNKAPVIVRRDLAGQLANRILQAVIREASNIVQMGLATAEDVDTAIKMGMGIRLPVWGILEHIDAVGLDLALSVQRDVLPGLYNEPAPAPYLEDLVQDGKLGYKSGKGFYDWSVKDMEALADLRDRFIIQALQVIRADRS